MTASPTIVKVGAELKYLHRCIKESLSQSDAMTSPAGPSKRLDRTRRGNETDGNLIIATHRTVYFIFGLEFRGLTARSPPTVHSTGSTPAAPRYPVRKPQRSDRPMLSVLDDRTSDSRPTYQGRSGFQRHQNPLCWRRIAEAGTPATQGQILAPCRIPIRHGVSETRRNPPLRLSQISYAVTTRLLHGRNGGAV